MGTRRKFEKYEIVICVTLVRIAGWSASGCAIICQGRTIHIIWNNPEAQASGPASLELIPSCGTFLSAARSNNLIYQIAFTADGGVTKEVLNITERNGTGAILI